MDAWLINRYSQKLVQYRRINNEIDRRYREDNRNNPHFRHDAEHNLYYDSNNPQWYRNVYLWLHRMQWACSARSKVLIALWDQMNGYEKTYVAYKLRK